MDGREQFLIVDLCSYPQYFLLVLDVLNLLHLQDFVN